MRRPPVRQRSVDQQRPKPMLSSNASYAVREVPAEFSSVGSFYPPLPIQDSRRLLPRRSRTSLCAPAQAPQAVDHATRTWAAETPVKTLSRNSSLRSASLAYVARLPSGARATRTIRLTSAQRYHHRPGQAKLLGHNRPATSITQSAHSATWPCDTLPLPSRVSHSVATSPTLNALFFCAAA
jgi:hypothetical protein